jgi:hypothetical protein
MLRERQETRGCRARAARPAHRHGRDRARDRNAARPRPSRGRTPDSCPALDSEPQLAADTGESATVIQRCEASCTSASPSPEQTVTPKRRRAALRRPSDPGSQRWIGRGASCLAIHPKARRPAARIARPLRSALAIPLWVSGTRLYPLVPPLPVLLESVTSGPPPFRGTSSVYRAERTTASPPAGRHSSGHDHDHAVLAHAHRERLDCDVGGER